MNFLEACQAQAETCRKMGSPFMGQLMALCAARMSDQTEIGARLLDWPGDCSPLGDATTLRLAGGLHGLKLAGYAPLAAVYPPARVSDDALWAGVARALTEQAETLHAWLDRPPQTNEPRRSSALVLGLGVLAARGVGDVALLEIGASGGVNLMVDHIAVDFGAFQGGASAPAITLTPDVTGTPPRVAPYRIRALSGCDRAPLSLTDLADQHALLSYTWPDQPERQARLAKLFARAEANDAPQIAKADAAQWLAGELAQPCPHARVVWHSIFWQYPPQATRDRLTEILFEAGASAGAPLGWLRLEPDGGGQGAAVLLDLWQPGVGHCHEVLARAGYHGEWLRF